ncbi:MAG TPA: hypothetical protein VFV53_10855, partial [Candidatus Limnocylindrales bacterium]|nr:hypothetical protein [Candidatus Limnocylindrales bacterium]
MRRSWLDALADLIDRAPAPRWVVYFGAAVAWIAFGTLVSWVGPRTAGPLVDPMLAIGIALPLIALWAMQALDDVALQALATLRPQLDLDDQATADVASDLRRTPPAWAAVALVIGALAGLGSIIGNPASWGLDEHASGIVWAVRITMAVAASIVVFG